MSGWYGIPISKPAYLCLGDRTAHTDVMMLLLNKSIDTEDKTRNTKPDCPLQCLRNDKTVQIKGCCKAHPQDKYMDHAAPCWTMLDPMEVINSQLPSQATFQVEALPPTNPQGLWRSSLASQSSEQHQSSIKASRKITRFQRAPLQIFTLELRCTILRCTILRCTILRCTTH